MSGARNQRKGAKSKRTDELPAVQLLTSVVFPNDVVSIQLPDDDSSLLPVHTDAWAGNSPFEVVDWSMKEAAPQRSWEDEARGRIKRSDVILIMLGPLTYKAPGVLKEVRMTREANKPIYQIIGYRDADPTPVPNGGRLLRWNWENLKKLFQ